jgi:hypothetical protein
MSDSLAHEASDAGEDQMETMGEVEVPVVKRGRGNPRLAEARLKAHEARRQQGVISKAKKAQAKAERESEYQKALEFLNGPEKKEKVVEEEPKAPKAPKEKGGPRKTRVKTIEISDSSSSESEESSDSDGSIDVVRVVRKPKTKKPPPPKKKKSKVRVESEESEEDEEDNTRLAGVVARDLLRKRVLEKAATDAIRRLVPNYRGSMY